MRVWRLRAVCLQFGEQRFGSARSIIATGESTCISHATIHGRVAVSPGHGPALRAGHGLARPGPGGPCGHRVRPVRGDGPQVRRGLNRGDDGELRPARPWAAFKEGARGDNPGGGLASSVSDLLRWARFQLGDGEGVLPTAHLHRMWEQTVGLRASTLGEGFGICWFLHDLDGLHAIGHGGSANGQFAELLIVPERDFAVVSLANAGPDGYPFNQSVVRWALEHYLGVVEKTAEPVPYDETRARQVAGRYEIDAINLDIATDGTRLTLAVAIKPEIREASQEEMRPDYPAADIAFLPGDSDEYIVTEGGLKGQRGYFSRDAGGAGTGIDLAGRLFNRVTETS
ncbi:serine hydrolase domain-containing protein [Streptomyces spiralis]